MVLGGAQDDPSWQTVLRALHAVEAVVQQGATAACGAVAVHFQVTSPGIRRTCSLVP